MPKHAPNEGKESLLSGAYLLMGVIVKGTLWRSDSPFGKFRRGGGRALVKGWNAACREALLAWRSSSSRSRANPSLTYSAPLLSAPT